MSYRTVKKNKQVACLLSLAHLHFAHPCVTCQNIIDYSTCNQCDIRLKMSLFSWQKVCIKGLAQIEVLCGSTDIFGSILKPGHAPVDIFSGSTSSLITFSECSQDDFSTGKDFSGKMQHALRNQPQEVMKMIIARGMKMASILLLKSLQTVEVNFVSSFKKYGDIFKLELGKVDCYRLPHL